MKNIPAVPKPESPKFIDEVVVQIQDILKNNLSWLDYSFGRAQRLTEIENRKDNQIGLNRRNRYYPGVHIRNGEYLNVFPDQELGNYSFFMIEDPQEVIFMPHNQNNVKVNYSIIFWFDLDSIFGAVTDRNTEEIKSDILDVLTNQTFLTKGRINVSRIYEKSENIYKGYDLDEVKSQCLMQPFAGFRFEGEMIFNKSCS